MGTRFTARPGRKRTRAVARRERELARLAGRQHGVLSRSQLVAAGVGPRTIRRRVEAGRLHLLHRGVYVFGVERLSRRGGWMGAVLACGDGALLSHRSGAALWGLLRSHRGPIEVTSASGRGRAGIAVREGGIRREERSAVAGIPVTSVARTLFDLAEVLDQHQLERAFEEADRLGLLEMRALEEVCVQGHGRHALAPVRRLIDEARAPLWTRSDLEDRFQALCREHRLPPAHTNVSILGHEVDVYWPEMKLVVEADSWTFHHHRGAFEHDRARDAAMQAAGYRVIRVTHRRLEREPERIAAEIRSVLSAARSSASTTAGNEGPDDGRAAT
jgi:very-short-patch-repair endonuclease